MESCLLKIQSDLQNSLKEIELLLAEQKVISQTKIEPSDNHEYLSSQTPLLDGDIVEIHHFLDGFLGDYTVYKVKPNGIYYAKRVQLDGIVNYVILRWFKSKEHHDKLDYLTKNQETGRWNSSNGWLWGCKVRRPKSEK